VAERTSRYFPDVMLIMSSATRALIDCRSMTILGAEPISVRVFAVRDSRARLTDALIDRLPPALKGLYVVRDEEQPGFFIVVGKRTKTYTIQSDLRRGSSRKCLRIAIGRHGDPSLSTRLARAKARELMGRIARGEDPTESQPRAEGPTLRQAWDRYEEAHLRRKGRSDWTIEGYRELVEKVLRGLARGASRGARRRSATRC
jgi:hypothetical protein